MRCWIFNNGSTKNGTIRETEILVAIQRRFYLCSAFEIMER